MHVTIDGFENMSAQQVFDKAALHLLTQGEQSRDETTTCVYRAADGRMCAAGPFIKDEWAESCEGLGWRHLADEGKVPTRHRGLVMKLQEVHDGFEPHHWEKELRRVANFRGLSTNVIDNFKGNV